MDFPTPSIDRPAAAATVVTILNHQAGSLRKKAAHPPGEDIAPSGIGLSTTQTQTGAEGEQPLDGSVRHHGLRGYLRNSRGNQLAVDTVLGSDNLVLVGAVFVIVLALWFVRKPKPPALDKQPKTIDESFQSESPNPQKKDCDDDLISIQHGAPEDLPRGGDSSKGNTSDGGKETPSEQSQEGASHDRTVENKTRLSSLGDEAPSAEFASSEEDHTPSIAVEDSLVETAIGTRTRSIDALPEEDCDLQELERKLERCDKLKKQGNAKFNRGDADGARVLYTEGIALLSGCSRYFDQNADDRDQNDTAHDGWIFLKAREMIAALYSNRAVTFYRERLLQPSIDDCNRSLELNPKSEKTYIRKWRSLDAMGEKEQTLACLEDGVKELPESKKLMDQLRKSLAPPSEGSGSGSGHEIDTTLAVAGGWGTDIAMAGDPNYTILERVERLKKQANAKFNKGDIDAARALYTDALACIPQQGFYSRGVKALLSEIYSNRAVTYYRRRKYQESLQDCEQSIQKNPENEKSYIRKARALTGLERRMDAAYCLKEAYKLFPSSKKIKDELNKIRDDASIETKMSHGYDVVKQCDANSSTGNDIETPTDYAASIERSDRVKRNANAKFNRGDVVGARLLYTEAMGCLPDDRVNDTVRISLAILYANRALTYHRELEYKSAIRDCDHSIELDPTCEKSYYRKARALVSMKCYEDAIRTLEWGERQVPGSDKLKDELNKIRQEHGDPFGQALQAIKNDTSEDEGTMRHSSAVDNNESNTSFSVTETVIGSVFEEQIDCKQLARADKLKKQANAKLNKGDVAKARMLYGEGLACMPPGSEKTPEGRQLAADLYANRAVTFFREKKFRETVNDCNKAVEFDPKHEKSYIRKWRALSALGSFDDAIRCLESALKELPDSERFNEELANATKERNMLNTVNQMIANQEYQQAHDILEDIVKTSDNLTLWLASARTDLCLGNTDSALDRVEKVLMFNPKYAEALRVRGFATFLSGDMEHGVNRLKEALEGDSEDTTNRTASGMLQGCQQKMNNFHKGQARVKRGRYREAVELFTSVMTEGIEIPRQSQLYGILLTERAEANMLSSKHEDALKDCVEAISLKQDNLLVRKVKIKVYEALGRLQEARDELKVARKMWGAYNETIEDFELRLRKVDNEVRILTDTVIDTLGSTQEFNNESALCSDIDHEKSCGESYSESDDDSSESDDDSATTATTSEDHRRRADYRVQVEKLVQNVLPDQLGKIDAMMDQFKGREAELVSTLQIMAERSSNQRARAAIHNSKSPSQHQNGAYSMGLTNGEGIQGKDNGNNVAYPTALRLDPINPKYKKSRSKATRTKNLIEQTSISAPHRFTRDRPSVALITRKDLEEILNEKEREEKLESKVLPPLCGTLSRELSVDAIKNDDDKDQLTRCSDLE